MLRAQRERPYGGAAEYRLTTAGEDLRDVIMSLGVWGQRWIESSLSLKNLDPSLLMWDMRRNILPTSIPKRKCTVQFVYPELAAKRNTWWLVIDGRDVDLCSVDPGFDIDLYVSSTLRSMTAVWTGHTTLKAEINAGHIDEAMIDSKMFSKHLYTRYYPDPDLLIRTSGEMRISNFLLWQLSYTEMYVTPKLWPDFTKEDLFAAVKDFGQRQRRYGAV